MADKVIVFDITSKLAHFRKINTNSSSLTYLVPPRTTVLGMIAAMLGKEKDSYYVEKDFMALNVAVIPLYPHRTITQSMNYLFVESKSHLNGSKNHTQVPVEHLISEKTVGYRIIVSGKDSVIKEIKNVLELEEYAYSISLGPAYCLSDIDYVGEFDVIKENVDEFINLKSVTKKSNIEKFNFSTNLYKEVMPYSFDGERRVVTEDYIFSKDGKNISLKLKEGQVYSFEKDGNKEYFTYM